MPIYLVWTVYRHFDMVIPEFQSLCAVAGVPFAPLEFEQFEPRVSPFLRVELPNDEAARVIGSRSILSKGIFEIWGEGTTYDEMVQSANEFQPEHVARMAPDGHKWSVMIEGFGRKFSIDEKRDIYAKLQPINWMTRGSVSIEHPDNVFWVIEDVGKHSPKGTPARRIYFGREVAASARHLIGIFDVKRRDYIGTTSMDAELSLIMSNMAKAKKGSLILDPFAGTGSLLCTCSYFGSTTIGSDIDPRVLRGKVQGGRKRDVYGNFAQYGIAGKLGGLVAMDNTQSAWHAPLFDAIVTDPPYGVRAGAKKTGWRPDRGAVKAVPAEMQPNHIPSKVMYELDEVLVDLLVFAAKNLRIGGRLVFWLPTTDSFQLTDIPTHPCLTLLAWGEQRLAGGLARRLVSFEKSIAFDQALHGDYVPRPTTEGEPAHYRFTSRFRE